MIPRLSSQSKKDRLPNQRSMQSQGNGAEAPSGHAISASHIFKNRKVFNDPIHGQIELHPVCVRIVDTPQFQRLRHIKQLDTCYLVYPGASHNRFEHSLGVCYLAGKLLKTIRERQPDEPITDRDILCVEIAGLCHDLGQGPFSHVFEKRFMPKYKKGFTHEGTARKMFEHMLRENDCQLKKDIQRIIADCKIPDFPEFTDEDFTFMLEMIDVQKDIGAGIWPYKGRDESKSFMYEIVANKRNGIDVDKWDYIARDSYMLGMKVNFDYNRCFTSARVIKCNGTDYNGNNATEGPQDTTLISGNIGVFRKQICYREKEAQDLYDMFYSRMTLHRRAYQHKTHTIIGMMICDALTLANDTFRIAGKKISETVDDMNAYTYLTDDVMQMIYSPESKTQGSEKSETNADRSGLDGARSILLDIMNRKLYKCVAQTHAKNEISAVEFKEDFFKFMKEGGHPVEESFIDFDIVKLDYGMDEKDPMGKVRFYKKDDLNKPIKLKKIQVSYVLPETFAEHIIRVYCKVKGPGKDPRVARVQEAFEKWCDKKGLPRPKAHASNYLRDFLKRGIRRFVREWFAAGLSMEEPELQIETESVDSEGANLQRTDEPIQPNNARSETDSNENTNDDLINKHIAEPQIPTTDFEATEQPGSYHAGGVDIRPEQSTQS